MSPRLLLLVAGCSGALAGCTGAPQAPGDSATDTACEAVLWYEDADGDGFGDPDSEVSACTLPPGHVARSGDCDDTDRERYPGAPEVCDGADQDCDSQVDENAIDAATWYVDADGDGVGGELGGNGDCPVEPWSEVPGDCDDVDPAVFPGALDACGDGVDADCDGEAAPGCTLEGELDPSLGAWSTGPEAGATAGQAMALLPDGSGILVGADAAAEVWLLPPEAVVQGGVLEDEATWSHSGVDDRSGAALDAWDLDGDGHSDALMGAWAADTEVGEASGRTLLALGPLSGAATEPLELPGFAAGSASGWSLAGLDWGEEAVGAVLIGGLAQPTEPTAAALYTWPLDEAAPVEDALLRLVGVDEESTGDAARVHAGDLDGDGLTELLLAREDEGGGGVLRWLPGDHEGGGDVALEDLDALTGPEGARLGRSVATADLDEDGRMDLLLGAPGEEPVVYGVSGPLQGGPVEEQATFVGRGPEASSAGHALCVGLERDGQQHLVVGAPLADEDHRGALWALPLPLPTGTVELTDEAVAWLEGPGPGDRLGTSLLCGSTPAHDLDGDELTDLLTGVPFHDEGTESEAGAALWLALPGG